MSADREPRRPRVTGGYVEVWTYGKDGTRRRVGKRIAYGEPCECDACQRLPEAES